MQGLRRQPGWVRWPEVLALALMAMVQVGVCAWTPLMVSPDGMDYLSGAMTLAKGGGLEDVVVYKAPGLTFVLALVMWVSGGGIELLHWVQAGSGVGTAVLVWLVLTRFGRWRALVGGLVVGLHPVLLVYEGYLLRESLAAFLLALIAWLLVVAASKPRKEPPKNPRTPREIAAATMPRARLILAFGVSCGAVALLRENGLVTLTLAAPLVWWLSSRERNPTRRVMPALMIWCVAGYCVFPWVAHVQQQSKCSGVTVPKTQFNRAVNGWWNGMLDGTELPGLERGKSDYEYVAKVLELTGIARADGRPAADVVVHAISTRPREVEAACREVVETAMARQPSRAWRDRGVAFVGLMGLWDIGTHPAARADGYNALPLRGKSKWGTNFLFDVEGLLSGSRFTRREVEFREVLGAGQQDIAILKGGLFGRVFDWWWRGFELVRYAIGWAFFVGLGIAFWKGARPIAAIGLIVLVNLGGAAWVVMSPTDRVAAPFIPLMVAVAVYGLGELVKAGRASLGEGASRPSVAAKQVEGDLQ